MTEREVEMTSPTLCHFEERSDEKSYTVSFRRSEVICHFEEHKNCDSEPPKAREES